MVHLDLIRVQNGKLVVYLLGVRRFAALGVHSDLVRDKEAGVKPHTELPDQGHVGIALRVHRSRASKEGGGSGSVCKRKLEGPIPWG